jgi:regulator of sigma E protease
MITNIKGLIIALLGLGFLVFIHELGHFLFCKLFSVPAPFFAIGVGPKIYKKTYKGTEFSIGILPVAGYVQIGDNIDGDQSILNKYSYHKGLFVLLGGIIYNIIFTFIVCIGLSLSQTYQTSILGNFFKDPIVVNIKDPHLAGKIYEGDRIILCNNKTITTPYEVAEQINNTTTTLVFLHNEETVSLELDSEKLLNKEYFKIQSSVNICTSYFEKITDGFTVGITLLKATAHGLISIFSKKNIKRVSGFLGILKGTSTAAEGGFYNFLAFLALLSINLALFNLLPLPILDGGQIILLTIAKVIRRELSETFQSILMYGSFLIMGLLMLFSTYNDVLKIFFK